jgi:lantibiotic biosynthesis protein
VQRLYQPAAFCLFRTPLLSAEQWFDWTDSVNGLAGNDDRLRHDDLRRTLRDGEPALLEAIAVSTPPFAGRLRELLDERKSAAVPVDAVDAVRAYHARASLRSTPFGMLAPVTAGTLGDTTELRFDESVPLRQHIGLDLGCLRIASSVGRTPQLDSVLYVINPTALAVSGEVRFYKPVIDWTRALDRYEHVVIGNTPVIEQVIESTRTPRSLADLVTVLACVDAERRPAYLLLMQLVEIGLLLPDDGIPIDEPTLGRGAPPHRGSAAARPWTLGTAHTLLDSTDQPSLNRTARYCDVHSEVQRELEGFPFRSAIRCDSYRCASTAMLDRRVAEKMIEAVEIGRRLVRAEPNRISQFRKAFVDRFGEGPVPLLLAIDPDRGVPFGGSAPLDAKLPPGLFSGSTDEHEVSVTSRETNLLLLALDAMRSGKQSVRLSAQDLQACARQDVAPLPDTFCILATLLGSAESGNHSDVRKSSSSLRVYVTGVLSGLSLLGRFSHLDDALTEGVRTLVAQEELTHPDVCFAEILHWPNSYRLANVATRTQFREHSIPFFVGGSKRRAAEISLGDLLVHVDGDRVVLTSARLGKEIRPTLGVAHNFRAAHNLPLYSFLAELQWQGHHDTVCFRWPALCLKLPALPRIEYGDCVLSPAQWRLQPGEIDALLNRADAELVDAFRAVGRSVALPRYLVLSDGDLGLPFDSDHAHSVRYALKRLRRRPSACLEEQLQIQGTLVARGAQGRYACEVVLPVSRAHSRESLVVRATEGEVRTPRSHSYPPGSEWAYAKLYGGAATLDRLVVEELPDQVSELSSVGINAWHFVRYSDPDTHLRLRFRTERPHQRRHAHEQISSWMSRLVRERIIWRAQWDTYVPEYARYGGPEHRELADEVMTKDSASVLMALASLVDKGDDLRASLAVESTLAWLDWAADSRELALRVCTSLRDSYRLEFGLDAARRRAVAMHYREWRSAYEARPQWIGEWLEHRERALRPTVTRYRASLVDTARESMWDQVAKSLIHMTMCRLLIGDLRRQELVLYDFAARLALERVKRTAPVSPHRS